MELKTFRNNFLPEGMDKAQRDTVISAIFNEVTGRDFVTSLVMGYELKADELIKMQEYTKRVFEGEPVQYVLGKWDFMGRSFAVDKRVLIPRADTELLCELVLEYIEGISSNIRVLDLCTGSGCIGISLSLDAKNVTVSCSDISEDALNVARDNAKMLGAEIEFIQSDMLTNCDEYDVIVSNPPYIPQTELSLMNAETKFEPETALLCDGDGLKFYRVISEKYNSSLKDGGMLAFEVGFSQAQSVCEILKQNGYKDIKTVKDYNGTDRVVCAIK